MPTTPTDDPLANSDRTVGVSGELDHDTVRSLKRDALLFDQIVIPNSDNIPESWGSIELSELKRISKSELDWLRDIGIVRDIPWLVRTDHPTLYRQYLNAWLAETGEPIDVMAIPDERIKLEGERILSWYDPGVYAAVTSRLHSIELRRQGINAFPILRTRRQIGNVFPSGTTPVLEVVLKSMPIPDDETPWEDIIEFRNDPEARDQLRELRVWTRKFAKETTSTSLAEMKEEIEVHLRRYEANMKLHRMKVNKGATETLLTVTGKVAEDLVKLKWGELAKLPFILKERKISLLEAEAKAPNRELAFISIARERFSR